MITDNLLKTKINNIYMTMPIEALSFRNDVLNKLTSYKQLNSLGKFVPKFKKIEDLHSYGKLQLTGLLSQTLPFNQVREYIQEIEQSFATIGLKFKDSNFTVLDIKIEKLNLSPKVLNFIKSLSYRVFDLGDLSIQNKKKLQQQLPPENKWFIREIENAMEEFGVIFESSSKTIDTTKLFPMHKFNSFLTNQKQKAQKSTKNQPLKTTQIKKQPKVLIKALYFLDDTHNPQQTHHFMCLLWII